MNIPQLQQEVADVCFALQRVNAATSFTTLREHCLPNQQPDAGTDRRRWKLLCTLVHPDTKNRLMARIDALPLVSQAAIMPQWNHIKQHDFSETAKKLNAMYDDYKTSPAQPQPQAPPPQPPQPPQQPRYRASSGRKRKATTQKERSRADRVPQYGFQNLCSSDEEDADDDASGSSCKRSPTGGAYEAAQEFARQILKERPVLHDTGIMSFVFANHASDSARRREMVKVALYDGLRQMCDMPPLGQDIFTVREMIAKMSSLEALHGAFAGQLRDGDFSFLRNILGKAKIEERINSVYEAWSRYVLHACATTSQAQWDQPLHIPLGQRHVDWKSNCNSRARLMELEYTCIVTGYRDGRRPTST